MSQIYFIKSKKVAKNNYILMTFSLLAWFVNFLFFFVTTIYIFVVKIKYRWERKQFQIR
ncbi:hypothetical protein SAMN05444001_12522 [Parabacteroides chinchillae]|uniref:Uncharacterized protein n=1 Tax=Parabacteroides chinchillae TaxID=871327 RepID=A0A8G2BZ09_9BACT|nr:hypothetical protein SAMN05444001_12522 [Parabacteroides chinchillae]